MGQQGAVGHRTWQPLDVSANTPSPSGGQFPRPAGADVDRCGHAECWLAWPGAGLGRAGQGRAGLGGQVLLQVLRRKAAYRDKDDDVLVDELADVVLVHAEDPGADMVPPGVAPDTLGHLGRRACTPTSARFRLLAKHSRNAIRRKGVWPGSAATQGTTGIEARGPRAPWNRASQSAGSRASSLAGGWRGVLHGVWRGVLHVCGAVRVVAYMACVCVRVCVRVSVRVCVYVLERRSGWPTCL